MILASSGIIASSISGVDADWLAYYNRVIVAGGSLTTTEQNATKQLVADLKANSLWTPMKAIYPMVGASAAACKQNLKSASFTGTFTSGWTFSSSGVVSNGTSAYFDTTCRVTTDLANFDLSWSHFGSSTSWNGAFNGSLVVGFNSNGQIGLQNLTSITGTVPSSFKMMSGSVNSNASNDAKLYFDGAQQSLYTASSMSGDIGFILGALNTGTFPTVSAILFNTANTKTLTLGSKLNGTEISNLYSVLNTFNTSLSR